MKQLVAYHLDIDGLVWSMRKRNYFECSKGNIREIAESGRGRGWQCGFCVTIACYDGQFRKGIRNFMQTFNKTMVGFGALALVVGMVIFLKWRNEPAASNPPDLHSVTAQTTNRGPVHVQRPSVGEETAQEQTYSAKLPREKVEEYLRKHERNAASLLAAFHALQDTNYLREAATNFPNDPRVQWTVLARDVFPEDRRKWLDSFKASSPSNSLANYLSAQDYFKNHQPEAAVKELADASGKTHFGDFTMDAILDGEELGRFSGISQMDIYNGVMSALGNDVLPQLPVLKGVAIGIKDLQQQYLNSGDPGSAQALAQTGMVLSDRMMSGDSGKMIINQLVGMSSAAIVLDSLDKNTSYDFLGGKTPAQVLAGFKDTKSTIKNMNQTVVPTIATLSEDQMTSYWERLKIYGEMNALQWLQQQNAAMPSSGN
jgi:hypothetical protein